MTMTILKIKEKKSVSSRRRGKRRQSFEMTLMILKFLEVKRRLCASIVRAHYPLVGRDPAQLILGGMQLIACKRSYTWQNKRNNQSFHFPPAASVNPFLIPGGRYSNEKMRKIITIAIMIHELPFSIVEDEVWLLSFRYANSDFQKVSRKITKSDCLRIYETENKILRIIYHWTQS